MNLVITKSVSKELAMAMTVEKLEALSRFTITCGLFTTFEKCTFDKIGLSRRAILDYRELT